VSATTRRVVLVLVVALVASAQVLHRHFTRPARHAAPSTASTTSPPDQLRLGTLLLTRCEIGRRGVAGVGTSNAYCTRFDVPEDWDTPSGRHIGLRVAIVKGAAARSDSDLVTFLDGGPGGAATEDYPAMVPALALLRERRDILLVDQRGTGGSNALACPWNNDAHQPSSSLANSGDIASSMQLVQRCLAQVRSFAAPEHYTTTDAIRDLEAVRQALGAPRLNLVGLSYGTRVAQQYAARYPASVRSVVLDSVVPNALALGSDHARNLERALQSLSARCNADEHCRQSFGDSYATLYRLRERLRAQPQSLTARDPSSFEPLKLEFGAEDLAAIVRFNTYSPLTAALLPLTLYQADHGNYAPLLGQKKWISDDLGSQITGGMELSVVCAEDAELLAVRPEDAATLLGNDQIAKIQSACTVWPRGHRPAQFHEPFTSALPVLLLAGQYDPVTPPAYATDLLRTLTDARLLLAPGQGHGVIGAGCMPKLVRQFIEDLKPRSLDDRCLLQLGDTPAFVDFNGASP
jgi:pimeloyl-ACP methyl ester carboxylesterase